MELIKFRAKTKVDDQIDIVGITKTGVMSFGLLACQSAKINKDSYLNCYFNKDIPSEIYLEISVYDPKNSIEGYRAQVASNQKLEDNEEAAISFNVSTYLKRVGYDFVEKRYYKFEIIQISGTDYLRIDISKPIGGKENV